MQVPGNEAHFFRFCLLGKLSSINPNILNYSPDEQVKIMLCPSSAQATKLVNKFFHILMKARENIDNGDHITNLKPQTICTQKVLQKVTLFKLKTC